MEEVEISPIDTSIRRIRKRDESFIKRTLADSILGSRIRESLKCTIPPKGRLVSMIGFKRIRCAVKLSIKTVPMAAQGSDEPIATIQMLRISTARVLSTLEQTPLVWHWYAKKKSARDSMRRGKRLRRRKVFKEGIPFTNMKRIEDLKNIRRYELI